MISNQLGKVDKVVREVYEVYEACRAVKSTNKPRTRTVRVDLSVLR